MGFCSRILQWLRGIRHMKDLKLGKVARVSQVLIAMVLLALFAFPLYEEGFGLDPSPFRSWLIAGLELFGLPLLWAIVTVVMLWRDSAIGWWLSVCGDALLLIPILWTFNDNVLWHSLGALLVMFSLAALLTPQVRIAYLGTRSANTTLPHRT